VGVSLDASLHRRDRLLPQKVREGRADVGEAHGHARRERGGRRVLLQHRLAEAGRAAEEDVGSSLHEGEAQDLLLAESALDLAGVIPVEEVHRLVRPYRRSLGARRQIAGVAFASLGLDQVLNDLDGREAILGRMGEQRFELALRCPQPDAPEVIIDVAHDAPPFLRS